MTTIPAFRKIIWNYYRASGRDFPWRHKITPYRILVSEIMLQQTQAPRAVPKFNEFVAKFPSFEALAQAATAEVLKAWQGLGYNRRALFLKRLAETVTKTYGGRLPKTIERLVELPGIGPNTAAAIQAYAWDESVVYIETNIRRIFIHHFFPDAESVSDKELMPFVERALDKKNPREWYWALMDYGSALPKTVANPNRRSKHYTRQSKFDGSSRQLRGRVLKYILEKGSASLEQIKKQLADDERLPAVLAGMVREKLLLVAGGRYSVS